MFFIGIFGTGEDEKEIMTFHNVICPCCGRYTSAKMSLSYRYFHIFFIPLIKYHKKYLVRPACSCSVYEAEEAYAEELKNGAPMDMNRLILLQRRSICPRCRRELGRGFDFCPYCGEKL